MSPHEPVTRAFFATKSSLTQHSGLRLLLTVLVSALLAVLCINNWWGSFFFAHSLYLALPFQDYWRVAYHVHDIQAFDFRYLWQQHNEHRIVFPDIIYAIDVLLFRMRRIFPIVLNCAFFLASWLVLCWPVLREKQIGVVNRLVIVLTAGVVIGWKGGALALADPFLLQWTLMSLAALLALWLLGRSLTGCIVCAVIATYSCGSGLFLWPVLWLFAKFLGLPRRRFLVLLASGCLSIAVYFIGYRFDSAGSLLNLLRHPFYEIGFILTYLSMPFGGMKSPHFALYIGALHLLTALFCAPILLRRRPAIATVVCGWYLFTLLSVVTIAAGRMDPPDPTFTAARAARYLVPIMLTWGAVFILLLTTSALRQWRLASPQLLSLVLVVLMLISNRKLSWWWTFNLRPWVRAQVAEVSLENDVFDPKLVRSTFPDPNFVAFYQKQLRESRLSIYAQPSLLGQPAPGPYRPLTITKTIPVATGLEVIGRAPASATQVVLLAPNNTIIGTGRTLEFGVPWELMPPQTPLPQAWVAFIPDRYAHQPFRASRLSK